MLVVPLHPAIPEIRLYMELMQPTHWPQAPRFSKRTTRTSWIGVCPRFCSTIINTDATLSATESYKLGMTED